MRSFNEKVILVMLVFLFGFVGCILAEKATSLNAEDLSSPKKAFVAVQTAIQNENYEKAWQISAESFKQKFGGNFEEFKKRLSDPEMRISYFSSKIQEVKLSTPKEAEIKILVSFVVTNYMVLEDGVWKFAGKAEEHH